MTSTTRRDERFFGELYLRSTRPFISEEVTRAEGAYLRTVFSRYAPEGPLLDLGCGHGRHLAQLGGSRPVVGLDFDPLSLAEAKTHRPVVRGDFFDLPFREGSLAGAWAWYNSICTFEDGAIAALLRGVARCLRPDGIFVVHTSPRERIASQTDAHGEHTLPDGSRLVEDAHYEPSTGRDLAHRSLTLPDGRVMAADFFIRYYSHLELLGVLEAVGFRPLFAHGGIGFEAPSPEAEDLIVGVSRG